MSSVGMGGGGLQRGLGYTLTLNRIILGHIFLPKPPVSLYPQNTGFTAKLGDSCQKGMRSVREGKDRCFERHAASWPG